MATLTDLWSYRGLIGNFVQREVKVKYKRSTLGWIWSLINPAATLLIYTVVFGTFLRVVPPVAGNGHTQAFVLYLFTALVVWNFFSNAITTSMASMMSSGALLRKVYFPPACAPIASTTSTLIQAGVEAAILVVVMFAVGNVSYTFLMLPVIFLFLVLFTLGIGLVVSIFNVYYGDVGYIVGIALNLLFYATPIIYLIDMVPERVGPFPARVLIELNPLTQFVGATRDILYDLEMPSAGRLLAIVVWSAVALGVGWVVFNRKALDVSEEV
jgi:ABC-2 type transport system permease protein